MTYPYRVVRADQYGLVLSQHRTYEAAREAARLWARGGNWRGIQIIGREDEPITLTTGRTQLPA